jgi:hypothetical protein
MGSQPFFSEDTNLVVLVLGKGVVGSAQSILDCPKFSQVMGT